MIALAGGGLLYKSGFAASYIKKRDMGKTIIHIPFLHGNALNT
jgi:hypothetical protein